MLNLAGRGIRCAYLTEDEEPLVDLAGFRLNSAPQQSSGSSPPRGIPLGLT